MDSPTSVFDTPEDEVAACARWLDTTYPNWASTVDPDTLDMMSGARCVGGQLGVSWVDLTDDWADVSGQDTDRVDVFATYTDEWRREVVARR